MPESPPNPVVKQQLEGAVLRLMLSRPERRNAFNDAVVTELHAAAGLASRDDAARLVVLSGEGKSFCAGADIEWMRAQGIASGEENRRSALAMGRMFRTLDRLEKPLVTVVHGACIGGGLGLAAVADVVVAADDCVFAASEVRLGILPAVIGPYLLRKIGSSHCRELLLSGRRFDGVEAHRLGLVHHVATSARLEETLRAVIDDLLKGGPLAQAHIKRFLRDLERDELSDDALLEWTADEIAAARAREEGRSGLQAFLDKAPAPWTAD